MTMPSGSAIGDNSQNAFDLNDDQRVILDQADRFARNELYGLSERMDADEWWPDDAFPKIDVRTHPLLFGLLVDLDLDFVITSERLWGDHETVPSLAIYEALRDPAERGIAQYEHRWDGQRLQAVGA